jgi:hypothetical protein
MKHGKWFILAACIMVSALLVPGCSGATPGSTVFITVPGGVTTVPAVTVTLPGKVTTIPAATVTIPAIVITNQPPPTDVDILPARPATIVSHMAAVVDLLKFQCLQCHGPGGEYQAPLPPSWDGAANGSQINNSVYLVQAGSIQDHTARTADQCLGCHAVVR